MANPEHVEILKSGVDKWNEWRLKLSKEVDLSGALIEGDLSNANFSRANLEGADFRNATFHEGRVNFTGADLKGADFRDTTLRSFNEEFGFVPISFGRAHLAKANFSRADLTGSDFFCSDLNSADLSEGRFSANFFKADLTGANLTKAFLGNSILLEANLTRAILENAELGQSLVDGTVFADVDLRTAKGLDFLRFEGPCMVDYHTLAKSKQLPPSFLRGCGLSDIFIDNIPSLFCAGFEFFSAFISYSSGDKDFAHRLHDALQGKGVRCWLDKHEILPGDKIHAKIDEGIQLWDKVLLCCSEMSLGDGGSWWVQNEIESAFEKERKLREERGKEVVSLIPLDVDGYLFSDSCKSPFKAQLKSRNAAKFGNWKDHDDFEAALDKVVKALRADVGARLPDPEPKL